MTGLLQALDEIKGVHLEPRGQGKIDSVLAEYYVSTVPVLSCVKNVFFCFRLLDIPRCFSRPPTTPHSDMHWLWKVSCLKKLLTPPSCLASRRFFIRRQQKDITTARESNENSTPSSRTGALMLAVARGKVS